MKAGVVAAIAVCLAGCTRRNPPLTPRLKEFTQQREWALTIPGESEAYTVDWKRAGGFRRQGSAGLSADGGCLTWTTLDSPPPAYSLPGTLFAHTVDVQGTTRQYKLNGRGPVFLIEPSENCQRLAIFVEGRLIVIDAKGDREADLTEQLTVSGVRPISGLQLSSDGSRLALVSEAGFAVIDIGARKLLAQGSTHRYSSLSPDGKTLAYLESDGDLSLLAVDTGVSRALLPEYDVVDIGRWTPDGRFLLAGVARMHPLSVERMVAVDVAAGNSYLPLKEIGDPEPGASYYRWIKQTLLTK